MAATNVQSVDDGLNSPSSQRGVTSPWNQVVRGGGELEGVSPVLVTTVGSAPASPSVAEHVSNASSLDWSMSKGVQETVSSPDDSGTEGQADGSDNSGGGNASKKPAWNRPNGVVDAFTPVMGAAWPALSESTKPTLKSSSSESLKALSDSSLSPALQVTGSSSPSHKKASAINLTSTSTPNHVAPSRQRSMKRGGGNVSAANGVVSQQDLVVEQPSGKPTNAGEQASPRDNTQKGGLSGNDQHHHQRGGSYRRGRGDGSYHHNNYGGKRDHDRGNQEWNQHSRSFNNRDAGHLQQQQPQRGFSRGGYIRPSVHTSSAPFIPPPPMHVPIQPFPNNMMYTEVPSPVLYVPGPPPPPMPFGPPLPPQVYFFASDPLLNANIVSQIDYYFSNENLVKDTYLRSKMDEQGWVSASVIAGFKKVSSLTDNIQLILDAMRASTIVEVQGDKMRKRNDWMKWIMPATTDQYVNSSSPRANHEVLVSQVQGFSLHGAGSRNQGGVEAQFSRSSSEEFTRGEETVGQRAGSDRPSAG